MTTQLRANLSLNELHNNKPAIPEYLTLILTLVLLSPSTFPATQEKLPESERLTLEMRNVERRLLTRDQDQLIGLDL